MIKPKKTKKGKYTAQVYLYTDENGKKIHPRVTADSKEELQIKVNLLKMTRQAPQKSELTVRDCIEKYIELSKDVLSPTTIDGYRKVAKFSFASIMDTPVEDLTDEMMQTAINQETKRTGGKTGKVVSPKTIRNYWGVVSSSIYNQTGKRFNIRLPKVQRSVEHLPEPQIIFDAVYGTDIELPCLLALWLGFSISEIRGFTYDSIRDGFLCVDQVVVDTSNGPVVKKDAKVETRKREQHIPSYIMDLIYRQTDLELYEQGIGESRPLIDKTRDAIYGRFQTEMKRVGLDISFHYLRHIFASVMLTKLNIPKKIVQNEGGWSTSIVMDKVYSQDFIEDRIQADIKRDAYYEAFIKQKPANE